MSRVKNYKQQVETYSKEYGVDPKLVMAIMEAESGGRAGAVSPVGAKGLMQIMPNTAKHIKEATGIDVSKDLDSHIKGAVWYIDWINKQVGGDTKRTVAAYNTGVGNLKKYGYDRVTSSSWNAGKYEGSAGETGRYVNKVLNYYNKGLTTGETNAQGTSRQPTVSQQLSVDVAEKTNLPILDVQTKSPDDIHVEDIDVPQQKEEKKIEAKKSVLEKEIQRTKQIIQQQPLQDISNEDTSSLYLTDSNLFKIT